MTRPKWGKAGERLDPDERERRYREIRARANRARLATLADDRAAYQRWRAGLVVPYRITLALDSHGLYGPEVDAACEAREPEVDQWEAGERYPTWRQLCALSRLTGNTARFFTFDDAPGPALWETFVVAQAQRRRAPRVRARVPAPDPAIPARRPRRAARQPADDAGGPPWDDC